MDDEDDGDTTPEEPVEEVEPTSEVVIHVYRMKCPAILRRAKLGVFHSGVQIWGKEYFYAYMEKGSGVLWGYPGQTLAPPREGEEVPSPEVYGHYATHSMGRTEMSKDEVKGPLNRLRADRQWSGKCYDVLLRNCHHFTEYFVRHLVKTGEGGEVVPRYINRAARVANYLPDCMVGCVIRRYRKNKRALLPLKDLQQH